MTAMLAVLALDVPEALDPDPEPAAEPAVRVLRRALPGSPEEVVAFLEQVTELGEGDRTVLLLHPRHRTAAVLALARLARVALRTHRLVAVPTDLPPLASGLLVDLLVGLADRLDLDGGRAVALVPELERQLLVLGWVRTVTRLRHPEPSMAQHALSWFARRGFELAVRPDPHVRRLRPDSTAEGVRGGAAGRAAVLSGTDRDRAWLTEVLATARVSRATLAAPHPYARAWFGTARAAELVIFPADLDALAAAVADRLRIAGCTWCGLPGPGGPCSFCGADRPPTAELEPAPL
ncbi:MAG: hypothetical protein AVDCRST_MAG41-2806, partial [uncultured Corynebacteriales bacterium]